MTPSRSVTTFLLATLGVATAVLAASGAGGAATSPNTIVATRVGGFKKMGGAMKALSDQLKSGAPSKPVMLAAAQTILLTAREQPRLFPAGSGPASGVKTDALPSIWSDRATFDALLVKLAAESDKLVKVTNGGDAAAIGAQVKATGAVCAACHRKFRADT